MGDNSDWDSGPAESQILHFFPAWGELVWRVNGQTRLKASAWGGADPEAGRDYGRMRPRKTTPGTYVIHSAAPYVTKTWPTSRIPWGTPLRLSADGDDLLYETGRSNPQWASALKEAELSLKDVREMYYGLYGDSHRFDLDRNGIPEQWVFNDFGPVAIRYFRDSNRNRKLDKNETLSGEMFHTTPSSEASAARKLADWPVTSHGCIHIAPADRDRFLRAGAFATGMELVIHPYTEPMPSEWK